MDPWGVASNPGGTPTIFSSPEQSSRNGEVWHGNLDIIINNEVILEPIEADKPESPGGKSPVEVKIKSSTLSQNPQIVAQTIVFSFLQKQTHPERDHFLTPCIGVGNSEMIVMFYDSEHDVLLESSRMPILDISEHDKGNVLSFATIVVSWFIVNYKYLCSGLTEHMKSTYKADFFNQAKDKIHVYEKNLNLGNVGISVEKRSLAHSSEEVVSSTFLYKKHKKLSKLIFNKSKCDSFDDSN
ncbi:hypothetical protein FSP39_015965 [Pinctada imbricata]|uniref:Uncharacterized protein n=1 Tax=Pinctada imbricata TaxID=66713 RepID=A0AA89BXJ5_PINIB|nr:hypothetical protein FSP39_015965 [Pinctada imbricata]